VAANSSSRERVLITGASVGIGFELARVFARNGYDLILVSRRADALEAVAGRLEGEFKIRAATLALDLLDAGSPQRLFDHCQNENLPVEILVNNAGIGFGGEFGERDIQRQLDTIRLNVTALTHLTGLFLPRMIQRRSGRILNVASTAGFQPGPLMAVYYATKAYVLSFSQALAEELRNTGVTVTALCPGPTKTEFAAAADIESTRLFNAVVADAAGVAQFGYEATMQGKRVAIPGMMNKIVAQSNRFAPRILTTKLVRLLQERR
jgi:short-subunit dehydrogenase